MRIFVMAVVFAVTMGGLFLYENYKTPVQEQNYAKIVSELRQTPTPTSIPKSITKIKAQLPKPIRRPATTPTITPSSPSPTGSGSPASSPSTTPAAHIYYTSSSVSARYYYCDTDSGWKNLSKANLKQFSSPEELLKSYPNRTLHESCK